MFSQLQAEVRARLGAESPEIRRYRHEYEEELRTSPWRVSSRGDLIRAALEHDVLLLADFHALRQSQKTHLLLLQEIFDVSTSPLLLCVECLRASDQIALDALMRGRLSEASFRKKVKWKERWGFPWETYGALFRWARTSRVTVLGVNSAFSSLQKRDSSMARHLKRIRRQYPEHKLIVIVGDLHLAEAHLPRSLANVFREPVLRIFQNIEDPFFSLMRRGLEQNVDVIRYDCHRYAVQNVAPWVKWQNYLLWLDHGPEGAGGDGEEALDATDAVAGMVRWIGAELGVKVKESALQVYTAGDGDVWSRVERTADRRERAWIETMIEDGRSFYLTKAGWGYLSRPSVNHAASLAMQYIHDHLCGGARIDFRLPDDFERMIWIESAAYFGSKIINPKRKSETLLDIRASLSSRQADDRGQEALRLALTQKVREAASGSPRKIPWKPRWKSSWIAAAHLLGGLAGERLYTGYRSGRLSPREVRGLLSLPMDQEGFPRIYQDIVGKIESLPSPFRSKKEKL